MPRVHTRRRHPSGRGRDISCGRCGKQIENGANYRYWTFRYGGKRIRCDRPECAPRPGDLTQSKMGEVYNAQHDLGQLSDPSDVREALAAMAETVRDIASEYQQAAEHFGQSGENQERYEALDSWADELDRAASDLDDKINEEDADEDELQNAADEARGVADECPV